MQKNTLITDSGYWFAIFNARDEWHQVAVAASERQSHCQMFVTQAVITEAIYLLQARGQARWIAAFLVALGSKVVTIWNPAQEQLAQVITLMRKYKNLPMDYADASLVLLAEHLGHGRILTTDQRDFGTYRWKNHYPFDNLLEESNETV